MSRSMCPTRSYVAILQGFLVLVRRRTVLPVGLRADSRKRLGWAKVFYGDWAVSRVLGRLLHWNVIGRSPPTSVV